MQDKYSIELVDRNGTILADLSGRARNRRIVKSRNEADEITWELDLNNFEDYARKSMVEPQSLIIVDQTEVRIKRGNEYIAGGQVVYVDTSITSDSQTIGIQATGFLNLFKDRFTDPAVVYTNTQATTIAANEIIKTQALPNGDFGVTIGNLATVGTHDRTYSRTNIKDLLQNLTRVQVAPFDFEFTPDKVFNTYAAIGSIREEIVFAYPNNIKSFTVPLDGTGIANQVIALGSGFGEEAQTQSIAEDSASQSNYGLRQKIITPNDIIEQETLDQYAQSEIAAWSFPFELPNIIVDGNIAPFVTDYDIGDYVRVIFTGYRWLEHINRLYRIEKYELSIDDNDNEEIKLYLSA